MFAGYWSAEGCNTSVTGTVVDCCCNHLSFFAVLVVNEEKIVIIEIQIEIEIEEK